MADDEISQTHRFQIEGIAWQTAHYLKENVQPGDALSLEREGDNRITAFHLSRRIGYVSSPVISNILYPGIRYAAWVDSITFDDQKFSVELNIVVGIYGNGQQVIPTPVPDITQAPNQMTSPNLPYRASPVIFRAHLIAFVVALLLTPAIVGIVILVIWVIVARTTIWRSTKKQSFTKLVCSPKIVEH